MSPEETIYSLSFYAISAVTVLAAIGVVWARNLLRTALLLVVALAGVAGIFVLLSADFLAVAQVLIYVGATMVLMLFAIMLTPGQVELPSIAGEGQHVLALALAVVLFLVMSVVALSTPWPIGNAPVNAPTSEPIGRLLLTSYVLPFEVASVLLMVALVGAIAIARED